MRRLVVVVVLAACRDKEPAKQAPRVEGTALRAIAMTRTDHGCTGGQAMLNTPPPWTAVHACDRRIVVERADGMWETPPVFEGTLHWDERDLTASTTEVVVIATTKNERTACDGRGLATTASEAIGAIADTAAAPVYWAPIATHHHESQAPTAADGEASCPTREIDTRLAIAWRGTHLVLAGPMPGAGTYTFTLP